MARIEIYGNDSNVTLDDKVIGTDALDNSTKNFTVGAMLALTPAGTTYTAGTGIDITNNVISSTVVDTDTNNFVSNVVLNGTDLDFTGTGGAFQSSVSLSTIADKTVSLTGTGGIAIAGTYPSFTIDGSGISGGGGTITGTGVANIMTKWITNTQIGNSIVVEDGNGVGIGVQVPQGRLHVHSATTTTRLKLTTQGSNIGVQDGLDIALVDGQFAQMWLYEPNISLRFGTSNAERFRIDGAGQGWFQNGLRITGGIVDSNTTKGTNGQILSSTGSEVEWITAPPAGSTTLTGLTDTTISNPSAGNYLEYNGTAWVNTPSARPESLILKLPSGQIPITNAPGQDLSFVGIGQLTKINSLHINPVELSLASATEIEVVNACTAKVSLGAYIDNVGQSGDITFEFYEYLLGPPTLLGSASFHISNQSTPPTPTTFLSFFDFQAGAIYKFTAYSTHHMMTILPGSFIQIEILK